MPPHSPKPLLDNGTNIFASSSMLSGFEDLTNLHLDELFSDLLGTLFP